MKKVSFFHIQGIPAPIGFSDGTYQGNYLGISPMVEIPGPIGFRDTAKTPQIDPFGLDNAGFAPTSAIFAPKIPFLTPKVPFLH